MTYHKAKSAYVRPHCSESTAHTSSKRGAIDYHLDLSIIMRLVRSS